MKPLCCKGASRILLTLTLCTCIIDRGLQAQETAVQRPNIIWFMTEDIGCQLGCFGDSVAKTPHLDQLASEGIRFTNVYSVSGVCAPSRSALITGCYPTAIGTHNMRVSGTGSKPEGIIPHEAVPPAYVRTFTEHLRKAGYYCMNKGKRDYQFEAPRSSWDNLDGHWDRAPKDKPFFLYFNAFMVTHESSIWGNASHPQLIHPDNVVLPAYYPDNEIVRKDVARNYSNIAEMDAMMGTYLNDLKDKGLLENTIIVFLSDNGGPLPRGKREIYDAGLKVPMIIRFPGKQNAGETNDELISFVDLAPTMLSLAGVPLPETMHGRAFLGEHKDEPRQYIYAARDRMDTEYDIRRAVRDKRFKYIRNYKPEIGSYQHIQYRLNMDMMNELLRLRDEGVLTDKQMIWFRDSKPEEELYDTWNDPCELTNLAENPEYSDVLENLSKAHDEFEKTYPDYGFIPEAELIKEWWPGLKQPVTMEPEFSIRQDSILSIYCDDAASTISYQVVDRRSKPNKNWSAWSVYDKPLAITKNKTVYAVAHRIGYKESNMVSYNISLQAFNHIQNYVASGDASFVSMQLLENAGCVRLLEKNLSIYQNFIAHEEEISDEAALQVLIDKANVFANLLVFAGTDNADGLTIDMLAQTGITFNPEYLELYKTIIEGAEPEDLVTLSDLQLLLNNHTVATLETTDHEWNIFPNPFSTGIAINGPEHVLRVYIMDQLGSMIGSIHPETNHWLNLSFLADGLYFLSIFTASGMVVRKIFKQS